MSTNDAELTGANSDQQNARLRILDFIDEFASKEHLLRNMMCLAATPQIARLLSLFAAYQRIKDVSGDILEFGVWYGQNLILLENLRSIIEPFNKRRSIVGFDSFAPVGRDTDDINSDYFLDESFAGKIEKQIELHEQSNVLGHVSGRHRIIVGDIAETLPRYVGENRVVAAMLVDVPGERELKAIFECADSNLAQGGVLILDDLNDTLQTDVSRVFLEHQSDYRISPCPFLPSRSIAQRI